MISVSAAALLLAPLLAAAPPTNALPTLPPPGGPVTVELVLERFQRFEAGLTTLSARFRQTVANADTGSRSEVEGTLEFSAPNKLRLEHKRPEPQTIVADGKSLWVWRPSTNQAIRSDYEAWRKAEPLAQGLLDVGRYSELLKRYSVEIASTSAPDADGHRGLELRLRPKDKPGEFELRLRLSTRDFFPIESELRVGGFSAQTAFFDVKHNPAIAPERFRFAPPAGADVFEHPASRKGEGIDRNGRSR